jgi:glycosyltransferase involved in cell wall biosynthesis
LTLLTPRDAFADHRHVASGLRFHSKKGDAAPRASITIPTYRRPDLLWATIGSALHQRTDMPYEIVVVDNDSSGESFEAILPQLRTINDANFRYYVNADNIGMFGNWNRCIELAEALWATILNDDDVLYPEFLQVMFATLDAHPSIDGLVCRKAEFFHGTGRVSPDPAKWTTRLRTLLQSIRFDRNSLMHVTPRKMFFGNDLRNSLGFVFRKETVIAIGGYKPEEFPAADYFFYIRYCIKYNLYWLHRTLAAIGMGENESMKMDTLMRYMYQGAEVRESLASSIVPASWLKMHPALTSYSMDHMEKLWDVKFDWPRVERELNIKLPPPSLNRIRMFRLTHGGY